MKNQSNLTWTFIFLLFMASCGESKKEMEETSVDAAETAKTIKQELVVLQDSIDQAWAVMIADDDEKLSNIARLLKELEYTGKVNPRAKQNVEFMLERLRKIRYDQYSMASSDSIDQYDYATDTLVRSTTALAASTPTVEKYPLVDELLMDIQDEDMRVISYRIRYDAWAMEYNSLLSENREKLEGSDIPAQMLQKKPLFQLMPQ